MPLYSRELHVARRQDRLIAGTRRRVEKGEGRQGRNTANPALTYCKYVAGWASAALGRVFEDVFQGVYCEAYERLTDDEKGKLLILALQDGCWGTFGSWYLKQLISLANAQASDVLLRYG